MLGISLQRDIQENESKLNILGKLVELHQTALLGSSFDFRHAGDIDYLCCIHRSKLGHVQWLYSSRSCLEFNFLGFAKSLPGELVAESITEYGLFFSICLSFFLCCLFPCQLHMKATAKMFPVFIGLSFCCRLDSFLVHSSLKTWVLRDCLHLG